MAAESQQLERRIGSAPPSNRTSTKLMRGATQKVYEGAIRSGTGRPGQTSMRLGRYLAGAGKELHRVRQDGCRPASVAARQFQSLRRENRSSHRATFHG